MKIGFGDDALIYKLNSGTISNQRNYINCKHYNADSAGSSSLTITNIVGFDHDCLFKADDSKTFTINFHITNINSTDMPKNGYCGTFILSNISNSTRTINIFCKSNIEAAAQMPCSTISLESKTCQIYKLYYYGFSIWQAVKVI